MDVNPAVLASLHQLVIIAILIMGVCGLANVNDCRKSLTFNAVEACLLSTACILSLASNSYGFAALWGALAFVRFLIVWALADGSSTVVEGGGDENKDSR